MTLADSAYAQIRQDIVSGALTPDQPLRMDALKKRYGIGFSPLREALSRLQSDRIVISTPLRGFTVAPVALAMMWDVMESRILIESEALTRAIRFGDDNWESDVVSALHRLTRQATRLSETDEPSDEEYKQFADRHEAFHRTLISACRSEWLLDFAAKLYVGSERYRHIALPGAGPNVSKRDVQAEHRALADAAIARDHVRATELLKEHYRMTGEQIEQYIGDTIPQAATDPSDA